MLTDVGDTAAAQDFLFPEDVLNAPESCVHRAYLAPLNRIVDDFNGEILMRLKGPTKTYLSYDTVKEEESADINAEELGISDDWLHLMNDNGAPPHQLELRMGAVCSLMRNLDVGSGLVKNRRVLIVGLRERFVEIRILNSSIGSDKVYPLPRITFEFTPTHSPWTVQRRQFPLRLAYATTFNSCQGLTLDRVVLDLYEDVFCHGQLYTATSRVRNRHSCRKLTRVEQNEEESAGTDDQHQQVAYKQTTRNVVYKELLLGSGVES
jgi:hypothetical protein